MTPENVIGGTSTSTSPVAPALPAPGDQQQASVKRKGGRPKGSKDKRPRRSAGSPRRALAPGDLVDVDEGQKNARAAAEPAPPAPRLGAADIEAGRRAALFERLLAGIEEGLVATRRVPIVVSGTVVGHTEEPDWQARQRAQDLLASILGSHAAKLREGVSPVKVGRVVVNVKAFAQPRPVKVIDVTSRQVDAMSLPD